MANRAEQVYNHIVQSNLSGEQLQSFLLNLDLDVQLDLLRFTVERLQQQITTAFIPIKNQQTGCANCGECPCGSH